MPVAWPNCHRPSTCATETGVPQALQRPLCKIAAWHGGPLSLPCSSAMGTPAQLAVSPHAVQRSPGGMGRRTRSTRTRRAPRGAAAPVRGRPAGWTRPEPSCEFAHGTHGSLHEPLLGAQRRGTAARASGRDRPPFPSFAAIPSGCRLRALWMPPVAFAHGAGIAGRPGRALPVRGPLRGRRSEEHERKASLDPNGRDRLLGGLRHATGDAVDLPFVDRVGAAGHGRRSSGRGRLMTRVVRRVLHTVEASRLVNGELAALVLAEKPPPPPLRSHVSDRRCRDCQPTPSPLAEATRSH